MVDSGRATFEATHDWAAVHLQLCEVLREREIPSEMTAF